MENDGHWAAEHMESGCFMCDDGFAKCDEPVAWLGSTGAIYLHEHCAVKLAGRLIVDAEFGSYAQWHRAMDPSRLIPTVKEDCTYCGSNDDVSSETGLCRTCGREDA